MNTALCVICHNRPEHLADALASAAAEPYDQRVVVDMASDPPLPAPDGTVFLRSDANLGVAGGRNLLAQRADAEILVFLDDDAVFLTPAVQRLRQAFDGDPTLAVVGFGIQRADGAKRSAESPFRGARFPTAPRAAGYFLGGAHAIRREAMLAVGGYDDRFFYDGEETDLSFALHRAGWNIWFDPDIVVEHRPAASGRVRAPTVAALTLRNRILIVRRHLPWSVGLVHLTAWGVRSALMAARSRGLRPWLRAWAEGFGMPVRRHPLALRQLWQLHRRGGRVLW